MLRDVVVGTPRSVAINIVMIDKERLRKCPEDTSVEDESLARERVDLQVVGDLATKAAVLIINGVLQPEGQDVGEQFVFDTLAKARHFGAPRR